MKKILSLVFLTLALASCSIGEDEDRSFNLLPVYQFDVPSSFKVDSTSVFKVRYKRENDCQIYNGVYYNTDENDRTKVAIKIVELHQNNCSPDNETVYEVSLFFKPTQSGTYVLDFWTGKDPNGEDQFSNTQIIVP